MTGSCIFCIVGLYNVSNFYSSVNSLSYADVSMCASFLRYGSSDAFSETFGLTLSPSLGITCTGILSSGSDVVIISSYKAGIKYSLYSTLNISMVSAGPVIFQSAHLASLVIMILLDSGLYNLYVLLILGFP